MREDELAEIEKQSSDYLGFYRTIIELEHVFIKRNPKLKKKKSFRGESTTFENTPILRDEILEFIRKCVTGEPFSYNLKKELSPEEACRICGTELETEGEMAYYCISCDEFTEPIDPEGYKKSRRMGGEEIIEATGAHHTHYTQAMRTQIKPMQNIVSDKLQTLGIEIEPKDVPFWISNKKEAAEWIKERYALQLLDPHYPDRLFDYIEQFEKKGTPLSKILKELESKIGTNVDEIKRFLNSSGADVKLYKRIVNKLKDNGILKNNYLTRIHQAILDWTLHPNDYSRNDIIRIYKVKGPELTNMVKVWTEIGLIFPPRRGYGGPRLTPDFLAE